MTKNLNKNLNIHGCYDEVDERTFGAKVIAGNVTRGDITEENFKTFAFKNFINQDWTDFCVGCSGAYAKEASELKGQMSWVGAYALACRYIGYVPPYGMSIINMMKARIQYGIPEEKFYPFNSRKRKSEMANWKNLPPEAIENAYSHRDKSFFVLYSPRGWDRFDTFRAFMNKLRDKKIIVNTGVDGHAVSLAEQKRFGDERRIGGPDSYGLKDVKYRLGISVDGMRYFNRAEINQFFNGYIGLDMDRTLAELLNKYDGKAVKVEGNPQCWLIKDGKRRDLKNEATAWAYNTLLFDPHNVSTLEEAELRMIPEGSPVLYKNGEFYPIVQRMLEKVSTMSEAGIRKLIEDLRNQ